MKQRVAWLLAIVAWALQPAWAAGLPGARDLRKDAALARDRQGVVLVLFSSPHCPYCKRVLNEFLVPMSRNPEYQGKVVMRNLDTTDYAEIRDFSGNKVSPRRFADGHGVRLVPTVMVFDAAGAPVAKPVVGLTTVDYYGYYLDQAIDQGVGLARGLHAAATGRQTP